MKFAEFSKYLQKLEGTTKRLEITAILCDLIKALSPKEVDKAIYLSLGQLKAPFESKKFNIAERMMIRILKNAYSKDEEELEDQYSKTGDLGDVTYKIASEKEKRNLDILEVYDNLLEIAQTQGAGSQEAKVTKLTSLLQKVDKLSAKFIVRIVLGTIRLGFTDLTIIDALSKLLKDNKSLRKDIEGKYNIHPDIGFIAKQIKTKGIEGIRDIQIEVGVPILSQKAQRLGSPEEVIEKMKVVWAEYKFDGTRVQLHLDRSKGLKTLKKPEMTEQEVFIKTFTRNLEETTHQYPDIRKAAIKQINAESIILDGEAIGYDKKTGEFLPFQETMQRKRKHGVSDLTEQIPLKYYVFDLLYLDGKSLINIPLQERREILNSIIRKGEVIVVDDHLSTEDVLELTNFFNTAKEKGLEGLLIKKPDSFYEAGARAYSWIKLKKTDQKLLDDTVDCVVLGYYFGRGFRAKFGIGGFLAAIYDKDGNVFKTITKVGTGLKDDDFRYLKAELDKIKIKERPKNVGVSDKLIPDVWVQPKLVVELAADEISKSPDHTAEYALRFPRLVRFRTDKSPQDITTLKEIKDLYKLQKRGYY